MLFLTIESTCDETAAAVIQAEIEPELDSAANELDDQLAGSLISPKVLASVVASQTDLHVEFNGVVPEIAARAHVERILPVIHRTLEQAKIGLNDIDAVAVANTPGLSGSLLVGLMAAKSICLALDLPLVAVNHLHAHIYACQLDVETAIYPCIGMIVSGGHSHLYRFDSPVKAEFLGGTIDDAAGEAFDKVARMLGLKYPGGPEISKAALQGSETAHQFPRSFLKDPRLDFSFSGLKTAVRYAITGPGKANFSNVKLSNQQIADLAASFQAAVVECLVVKAIQATQQTGLKRLCVGGGVAANQKFRDDLAEACQEKGVQLFIAPRKWCTDNAVMGAIAIEKYRRQMFEDLTLDIQPGLVRN